MVRVRPLDAGLICLSVLLVTFAQLTFRLALVSMPDDYREWLHSGAVLWLLAGSAAYLLSFAGWVLGLRSVPLHLAYPLLGLSYPLVYLLAVSIERFGETLKVLPGLGVLLIVAGVYCIATPTKVQAAGDDLAQPRGR